MKAEIDNGSHRKEEKRAKSLMAGFLLRDAKPRLPRGKMILSSAHQVEPNYEGEDEMVIQEKHMKVGEYGEQFGKKVEVTREKLSTRPRLMISGERYVYPPNRTDEIGEPDGRRSRLPKLKRMQIMRNILGEKEIAPTIPISKGAVGPGDSPFANSRVPTPPQGFSVGNTVFKRKESEESRFGRPNVNRADKFRRPLSQFDKIKRTFEVPSRSEETFTPQVEEVKLRTAFPKRKLPVMLYSPSIFGAPRLETMSEFIYPDGHISPARSPRGD